MKWLLLQLNPRSEIKGNYCLRESWRLENFREAPLFFTTLQALLIQRFLFLQLELPS